MMKKKNKLLFYVFAITSSLCIICIVAAIAIQAAENSSKAKTAKDYVDEFGGNPDVYASILAMTDCASLQNKFDQAEENLALQEAGTPQYKWGLGYMKAADDRMREIGCYETNQIPIEQVIANTAAAAQTQTMNAAGLSSMPFIFDTPTTIPTITLAPSLTPAPTNTSFILIIPVQPSGSGQPCSCTGELDCKDFQSQNAAQACFDYCVANGYGDIYRLDQGGQEGVACEEQEYP